MPEASPAQAPPPPAAAPAVVPPPPEDALKSQPWSEVRWCEAAAAVVALEAAAVAPAQRSRVGPAVASAAASNYELSRNRGCAARAARCWRSQRWAQRAARGKWGTQRGKTRRGYFPTFTPTTPTISTSKDCTYRHAR